MVPFSEDAVVVKEVDEKNWELMHPLAYLGNREFFVVPSRIGTDFASVPRVFAWFLPRYGQYTKAAVLHDYLWRLRAAEGILSWLDADAIFRRAMRELGVAFLRRWIMWAAVRWAALLKKDGRRGWWKEGWRVLLVTLVALPIVLPPAAVILAALAAFWLVELVVWAALKLATAAKAAVQKRPPRKKVNRPTFEWKLS